MCTRCRDACGNWVPACAGTAVVDAGDKKKATAACADGGFQPGEVDYSPATVSPPWLLPCAVSALALSAFGAGAVFCARIATGAGAGVGVL